MTAKKGKAHSKVPKCGALKSGKIINWNNYIQIAWAGERETETERNIYI